MVSFQDELQRNCEAFAKKYGYPVTDLGRGFEALVTHVSAQAAGYSALLDGEGMRDADLQDFILRWSDAGVDAYLEDDVNRELLLIQAKWLGGKRDVDEDRVDAFFGVHSKLTSPDRHAYLATAGPDARQLLSGYAERLDDGWSVVLRFATNRPADSPRLRTLVQARNASYQDAGVRVTCELVGQGELKEIWDDAVSGHSGILGQVVMKMQKDRLIHLTDPYPTVVGQIAGNELKNLFQEHKNRLFAVNIRLPMQFKKDVNPEIARTASTQPERFFYYNNGVSAICSSFQLETNQITARDFQVINGAQTIGTIAGVTNLSPLVKVMFRLTAVEGLPSEFAEEVTRTNNTQNPVEDWDFRANDPIQTFLIKRLHVYSNRGPLHSFYYQPKRGLQGSGKALTSLELGRVRHAFLYGPIESYRAPRLLARVDEETGLYPKAFGVHGKLSTMWTENECDEAMFAYCLETHVVRLAEQYKRQGHSYGRWLKRLARYVVGLYGHLIREEPSRKPDYGALLGSTPEGFAQAVKDPLDKAFDLIDDEYARRLANASSGDVQPEYNLELPRCDGRVGCG